MTGNKNIKLELAQLPEKDKPQAVVIATLNQEGRSRQGIGAASQSGNEVNYNPQMLIDKAVQQAIERAGAAPEMFLECMTVREPGTQIPYDNEFSPIGCKPASRYEGQHRQQAGSMTAGQRRLLEDKAARLHTNLRNLAWETFQIEADKLSSKQAHDLIGKMRSRSQHRYIR